jgi:hypothetical protein
MIFFCLTTTRNYAHFTASVLYLILGIKTAVYWNIAMAFLIVFDIED